MRRTRPATGAVTTEAIAHARPSFLINRDDKRTTRYLREVHNHGSRPQRNRDEATDHECGEQQATIRK